MTLAPVLGGGARRRRRALLSAGLAAVAFAAFAFVAESRTEAPAAPTDPTATAVVTFSDEFDGPMGAPADPSRWANQVGGRWNYGKDAQYYTPGNHNAALTGRGTLLISARTETYTGSEGTRSYTSARLTSTAAVRFGHVEARIRMTNMPGAFPAFWLLGANYADIGWPASGELDVMEVVDDQLRVSGGVHGPQVGTAGRDYYWAGGNSYAPNTTWMAAWHVYAADWTSSSVTWSIDGKPFATIGRDDLEPGQAWAVDQPANILLNVAVGGYGGTPAPDFAASMEIDWIRVTR